MTLFGWAARAAITISSTATSSLMGRRELNYRNITRRNTISLFMVLVFHSPPLDFFFPLLPPAAAVRPEGATCISPGTGLCAPRSGTFRHQPTVG